MTWAAVGVGVTAVGTAGNLYMQDQAMDAGGDAPLPPDYLEIMKRQEEMNRLAMRDAAFANRPDQIKDTGTLSWEHTPGSREWTRNQTIRRENLQAAIEKATAAGKDKKAARLQKQLDSMKMAGWGADKWTQKETLDPRLAAANQAGMDIQQALADRLKAQGEFRGPAQVQWDPLGYQKYGQDIYEQTMFRARPEMERSQSAFDTKLRQQGLMPGTQAYDRAMTNMMRAHGDVATQAGYNARVAGAGEYRNDFSSQLAAQNQNYGQALSEYNMPWQQAAMNQGLLKGNDPNFRNFATVAGAGAPNMASAATANYNAQMGTYNAGQVAAAQQAQGMGQALQGLGNALGGYFTDKSKNSNSGWGGGGAPNWYNNPNYDPTTGMQTDYG